MPTGHDLALALRAAYLALHRRTDAALTGCGATADQFVILAVLAEGDALTQRDLARRASSDPNTVRAMLLILERRGFVARRPHRTDARARTVTLTAKGQRTCEHLWAVSEAVRKELVDVLHDNEQNTLFELLQRIVGALDGTTEGADPIGAAAVRGDSSGGRSATAAGSVSVNSPRRRPGTGRVE
jgi:DNA-binding MarR family transcriptional regulator